MRPLQQHLQLLAEQPRNYNQVITTIMEYYRATTAFNKLMKGPVGQGNPFGYKGQPHQMNKGKGKGHKGKHV